jgi:hypothetical protein
MAVDPSVAAGRVPLPAPTRILSLDEAAHELLAANEQTWELHGQRFRFSVPSLRAYQFQWFWDSCFHAVVWARWDSERAADELRALFAWQDDSGLIPHVVFWDETRVTPFAWHYLESRGGGVPFLHKPKATAGIQPPVIAQAVERIADDSFVAEALPSSKAASTSARPMTAS